MKLNFQSGPILRTVLEGLVSAGVSSIRLDDGQDKNALYPPDFSEDENGWYETMLGSSNSEDDNGPVVYPPSESGTDLGWYGRWICPWNPQSRGSWLGPYPSEEECLTAMRGEYSE